MRVLVCGSRYLSDHRKVWTNLYELDHYYGFSVLIHGDARGADRLARDWAKRVAIPIEAYPADWKHFGKAAGPIRNRQMLVEGKPDLVVAFPLTVLAESTGTKDMVNQTLWAKIPLIVIEGDTQWHLTK